MAICQPQVGLARLGRSSFAALLQLKVLIRDDGAVVQSLNGFRLYHQTVEDRNVLVVSMAEPRHCISAELHDRLPGTEKQKISPATIDTTKVVNHVAHYFGCLEICERKEYFDSLSNGNQDRIKDELRRVRRLKGFVANPAGYGDQPCLVGYVEGSMKAWREKFNGKIRNQLKIGRREHCDCPRKAADTFDPIKDYSQANGHPVENGHSVGMNRGVPVQNGTPVDNQSRDNAPKEQRSPSYDPNKDMNGYLMEFKLNEPADSRPASYIRAGLTPDNNTSSVSLGAEESRIWKGSFPGRKATVHNLVAKPSSDKEAPNFLSRETDMDESKPPPRLRYFHFPGNNMKWVEDTMSLYYRDSETTSEQNSKQKQRTPSHMLLRNEYWKGRMHGSHESFIHARHLRPLCELVSSNPEEAEQSPRNVVLFMPVLHWDTDRKAQTFSKVIDNLVGKQNREIERREWNAAQSRRRERGFLQSDSTKKETPPRRWDTIRNIDTLPGAVMAYSKKYPLRKSKHQKVSRNKFGRLLLGNPLAQLLYDASRLVEEMDNYRDKMMMEKYLYHESPMHPRRTLDQAYYHSVKSTRTRDRDQVVYRETTPREDALHQWKTEGNKVYWNCHERGDFPKSDMGSLDVPNLDARRFKILNKRCHKCASAKRHTENWKGDILCPPEDTNTSGDESSSDDSDDRKNRDSGRCKFCKSAAFRCSCKPIQVCNAEGEMMELSPDSASTRGMRCPRCLENIRKLSRLIMVDQLWMWILDENTILTFFPRRYGVNKQDASGLHKSIRERVERARNNQIRSVYDLALIILNECTRTIFDETKTKDRRPAVLDIFSRAIGRVTHKQTLAFNHMWESAEKLRRVSLAPDSHQHANLSELHIPLLNITPEGMLQREIRDILDELGIMIHLVKEQRRVLDKFIINVTTIINDSKYVAQATSSNQPLPSQWFEQTAKSLLADTDSRLRELEGLKDSAMSTSEGLDYLLSLKQQQASIIQAWQSIRHGEEAVKQGRAIMVFTTMTILFLPAAFIAGVFGMNNPELDPDPAHNKNPVTLAFQLRLMFGVTAGIIMLVCILAYSAFMRTFIWSIYHEGTTWILVRFGIYRVWLRWGQNWSSENRWKVTEAKIREEKSNERSAARKRFAREVEATKHLMAVRERKKALRKAVV